MELLVLPPELLFRDRALPLDNVELWRRGATTLVEACDQVFAAVLSQQIRGATSLEVVAEWLRAARLSFEWLEIDEAMPLRALQKHKANVFLLAEAFPEKACDVAQQLARWVRCDGEVWPVLRPLLDRLLPLALAPDPPVQLLPLLADLAADRWPRACVEASDALNIKAVADAALAFVRSGDGNAEAALAVWQTFAATVQNGTMEWEDEAERGCGRHADWHPLPMFNRQLCFQICFVF